MTRNTRRFFFISCLALCLTLVMVLLVFSAMAPLIHLLFVPYQFFLIGACVGALLAATIALASDRKEWSHYRLCFATVMISAFLLVVVNCVVFRVLGGEQFIRRLVDIFRVVFISP